MRPRRAAHLHTKKRSESGGVFGRYRRPDWPRPLICIARPGHPIPIKGTCRQRRLDLRPAASFAYPARLHIGSNSFPRAGLICIRTGAPVGIFLFFLFFLLLFCLSFASFSLIFFGFFFHFPSATPEHGYRQVETR